MFDNLPNLTKEQALEILSLPIDKLELSSDYYKAAFHLAKHPGKDTEKALIGLISSNSIEQAVNIARRKAVEVLALLRCYSAIPTITKCLSSDDIYLVENAAWALRHLDCKEQNIMEKVVLLLDNKRHNRRILIQLLSSMGAKSKLNKIKEILSDPLSKSIECSAAIAAIYNLSGDKENFYLLEKYLYSSNQNERQCAVQDVIDIGLPELLILALKSPVAPYFRLKALYKIWPENEIYYSKLNLFPLLEEIIINDIRGLKVLQTYEITKPIQVIFQDLFNTDFSRGYLGITAMLNTDINTLWPIIYNNQDRIMKDYGSLYYINILFSHRSDWPDNAIEHIENILNSCLNKNWPRYMKFKPIAILNLMKYKPIKYKSKLIEWVDELRTPFWACRYAALMSIYRYLPEVDKSLLDSLLNKTINDSHKFVRMKAKAMIT